MTERDLKKLNRIELLEMLIERNKEHEMLQTALEDANSKIAERALKIDKAGSLAEASLQLNGMFEAAEAACLQYTENIKLLSMRQEQICAQLELETKVKCEQLEKETEEKCNRIEMETNDRCSSLEQEVNERCEKLERETEEKCNRLNQETEEKCKVMLEKAKLEAEAYWSEVSGKIQEYTKSYTDLQKLWERSPFSGSNE